MVARNGGRAVDAARVAETFSAIDVEHAGTVNLAELEEWLRLGAPDGEQYAHLKDHRAKMLQAFQTFDIDDSKTLNKVQLLYSLSFTPSLLLSSIFWFALKLIAMQPLFLKRTSSTTR